MSLHLLKPPTHDAPTGLPDQKLTLVTHYIQTHLDEPLALDTLANVINISASYFLTRFKQSTGLAPHQYVMSQRLEQAKRLLVQTQLPIAEIANETGFADQSHLTRLMRRHTGLTPKLIRDRRYEPRYEVAVDASNQR